MDQIRIGAFIKKLRNEKGLTQEQLSEQFSVSRRTVSRWETGSNMPDLDLLMVFAAMVLGLIYTSGYMTKLMAFKKRLIGRR